MLSEPIRTSEEKVGAVRINQSSQGLPIPLGWGKNRAAANLLWYGDFRATAHTTSAGGKGGVEQQNTTYTYTAAFIFGIGFGAIQGVTQVYREKEATTTGAVGFSVFTGASAPSAWSYLTTNHPSEALRYPDIAYVAAGPYSLDSGASIRQHSFEVNWRNGFGGPNSVVDASPKDIITDFLTNSTYGALFPSGSLGDLTNFHQYCAASGIFFSPYVAQQEEAQAIMKPWLEASNAEGFMSEGVLKIVPRGDKNLTGNGVTYTAVTTIRYAITTAHLLESVTVRRKTPADTFNIQQVAFRNRATGYNDDIAEARDDVAVNKFGQRPAPVFQAPFICDAAVARTVAQLLLQRHLFVLNQYEFKLPYIFGLLEPMDLLTLTDSAQDLNAVPVRILEIEDGEDDVLTIIAEDAPGELGTSGSYGSASSGGYSANYSANPGNANAPVIFEPPIAFSGSPLVYIATSGGADWGGCEIWASFDDVNYRQVGSILGKSRHGTLTATLNTGASTDTSNTLAITLAVSGGTLASVSQADVDNLATPCWVDGEIIAFRDATLTGANAYDLTYLKRGLYGSAIASHASTTKFVRLDSNVSQIAYEASQVGTTIYVKLVSFNVYGQQRQDISSLSPYTYTIQGAPAPVLTGLALAQPFTGRSVKVKWDVSAGAQSYTVQVYDGATLEREVTGITQPAFEYTYEDALADGGPWRALDIKVRADGPTSSSAYSPLSVSNPQAAAPTGVTATPTASGVLVKTAKSADTDFAGMLVHASTSSGFTPGSGNLKARVGDVQTILDDLVPGTAYYLRVAHFDQFGEDSPNYASEISVTPARAVMVVTSLPGTANTDDVVLLTTTMTLYRWNGSAWV